LRFINRIEKWKKKLPFCRSEAKRIFREGYRHKKIKDPNDFFFGWLPQKIKKYLKLFLPFVAMLIVLLLPIPLAPDMKKALALFLCIALLWSLEPVSIIVTSLMVPILVAALQLSESPFSSFSNPIIYLVLSGLMIAQAFQKHGLDTLIAKKLISYSNGSATKLLFFTMLGTAIIGMWMSNTATIAMFIPIILSLSKKLRKHIPMLLIASALASSIGGMVTILGASPNAITAAYLRERGDFSFFDWSLIGLPVAIMVFITVFIVFIRYFRLSSEKIEPEPYEAKKLTYGQKKLLAVFIPTIILWLIGYRFLPPMLARPEMIGLAACIVMFAFHILEWPDVRKISWEIFLLIGGGLALGQVLRETGLVSFAAGKLLTILSGVHPLVTISMIIVLTVILSNFINNSSATIILVPVFLDLSMATGVSPVILAMAVALATGISAMTPIAMPSFSMIYSTGAVKRKDMIQLGLLVALACAPIIAFFLFVSNLFK
jgi:solute carrier family 13 (sodium-dependent dicarboxylate transporter), member 2/3/5